MAEELDQVFQGEDRPVTMQDLGELKYLERVMKESLRLYPSVPSVMRTLSKDAVIGILKSFSFNRKLQPVFLCIDGHTIPAGCGVLLQIYDAHRDLRYYKDPEKFDPDRFLPENTKGRHPFAYIPFSAGLRNCIGEYNKF